MINCGQSLNLLIYSSYMSTKIRPIATRSVPQFYNIFIIYKYAAPLLKYLRQRRRDGDHDCVMCA